MTLDVYGGLYPDDVDELMERLERAHAASLAEMWPQRGPTPRPQWLTWRLSSSDAAGRRPAAVNAHI
jgi:hypothetical protein